MKHYALLTFTLLFSISSFSQVEGIDNADWLLFNLLINNENHFNPIDNEGNQIITNFGAISENTQYSSTSICDNTGVGLVYHLNNPSFTVSSVGTTLGGCDFNVGVNSSDVLDIQFKFASFFNNLTEVFSYEIVLENLDLPRALIITSPNGDVAIFFHSEFLSSKDFSKLSFKIYPNPVQDKLFISSENNLKNYNIQIFDLLGKLKMSQNLSESKSINVEDLSKGIYILSIKDDLGNTTTKKFVK